MKKLLKFIIQLILAILSYLLIPIVEIATFIVVVCKYGVGALDYFNDVGYNVDLHSASRNRSLWNFLLVKKGGKSFQKGNSGTISYHIGVNYNLGTLTIFGHILYWFLYAIDVSKWDKGGHCADSVRYFNSLNEEK